MNRTIFHVRLLRKIVVDHFAYRRSPVWEFDRPRVQCFGQSRHLRTLSGPVKTFHNDECPSSHHVLVSINGVEGWVLVLREGFRTRVQCAFESQRVNQRAHE